jgi:hypothetical protein
MLERLEPILKGLCVALAALLVFQVVRLAARSNPLAHLSIPALPTLPPDTNAPAAGAGTNPLVGPGTAKAGTNLVLSSSKTNSSVTNVSASVKSAKADTNAAPAASAQRTTNLPTGLAAAKSGTNSPAEPPSNKIGTNLIVGTNYALTNLSAKLPGGGRRSPGANGGMPPGMPSMGMGPFGRPGMTPAPELPLPTRARVYQITDSEILGPVMRPMPMALLGIAGDVAFLRSASGQTGLVKEGDSLGGLKLLRIGINRVLVEDDGQKKELTIFSGYGSESLLPKEKETSK